MLLTLEDKVRLMMGEDLTKTTLDRIMADGQMRRSMQATERAAASSG